MAEANSKVMDMVKSELQKNPDIPNKELFEKARSIDKGIDKLSARQFNATYPLQVKRSMKPARKRGARKRGKAAAPRASRGRTAAARPGAAGARGREQVRKVLVDLARDVAQGDRGALVEVAAGIDRYVDRILKATS